MLDTRLAPGAVLISPSYKKIFKIKKTYLEEITMALNIENIIAEIKEASILELNDLVKASSSDPL